MVYYLIALMESCWQQDPNYRPTFDEIIKSLESFWRVKEKNCISFLVEGRVHTNRHSKLSIKVQNTNAHEARRCLKGTTPHAWTTCPLHSPRWQWSHLHAMQGSRLSVPGLCTPLLPPALPWTLVLMAPPLLSLPRVLAGVVQIT